MKVTEYNMFDVLYDMLVALVTLCHLLNKKNITFRRTRSLADAVCFKHDNNVCACAVSAIVHQFYFWSLHVFTV